VCLFPRQASTPRSDADGQTRTAYSDVLPAAYCRRALFPACWEAYRRRRVFNSAYPNETHDSLLPSLGHEHKQGRLLPDASERLPRDKTIPARGTHSLEPSWRGRGFLFSGSWLKAWRTQSAIASASGVIVGGSRDLRARWVQGRRAEGGGRIRWIRAKVHSRLQFPGVVPATRPQRTLSHELSTTKSLLHPHPSPSSVLSSPTCKRLVSNGHAPHCRVCDADAHDCSAQEPTSKPGHEYRGSTG
jgi:hypothetical protein